MSRLDVIRAWKDPQYRVHLSTQEQADLPEHPAGSLELDDAGLTDTELDQVVGGRSLFISYSCGGTCAFLTAGCCYRRAVELE